MASAALNSSSSLPERSSLGTGKKAAIGVCVPLFLVGSTFVACWILKRRRKTETSTTDSKGNPDAGITQPELAARAENDGLRVQELYPIHIQEVATASIHELNAVLIHEIEASQTDWGKQRERRRHTPGNHEKPLPKPPTELVGSPLCQELAGEVGRQLMLI